MKVLNDILDFSKIEADQIKRRFPIIGGSSVRT
jgi:aspartate oxidase